MINGGNNMDNAITYYGDFSELTKDEAINVCESLKQGDIIVFDNRVNGGMEGHYKFRDEEFNYTFRADSYKELLEVMRENGDAVVDIVDRVDRSIRIKGGIWISWGMIDYKATAQKNGLKIDIDEVEDVSNVSILKGENDKLKAQIEELKGQIEMMKQSMILSPHEIRGSIWCKEGYNCVVVQTDDNEFMLINCDNYNRYYDETFARESIVGRLIEKGWALKSKGGN